MLFNSPEFIFAFLPASLVAYLVLRRFARLWLAQAALVLLSLFFYGWWNPAYLILIVGSMAVNYVVAKGIMASRESLFASGDMRQIMQPGTRQKLLLAAGVAFNLALLGYFKYTGFVVSSLASVGLASPMTAQIVLPLAISFFTFQQIAYLVDAHRGKIGEHDPLHYALFVTFFPQLIAGPIVHHSEMMPQFTRNAQAARDRMADFQLGLFIFAAGLFKKVIVADTIARVSTPVFDNAFAGGQIDLIAAWVAALGYTVQIYFDFSGYCDMATGVARMFGIRLPANFFSPYKSRSIVEFWRRWHITLSRFLRDYLYISLGGNRRGPARRHVNLMLTMVLGGLWHGAGWTFVFWGTLHGLYLVINHLWRHLADRLHMVETARQYGAYRFAAWLITFLAVVVAWVFFRAESFEAALSILSGMAGLNGMSVHFTVVRSLLDLGIDVRQAVAVSGQTIPVDDLLVGVVVIVLALAAATRLPNVFEFAHDRGAVLDIELYADERDKPLQWQPNGWWALVTGLVLAVSFMAIFSAAPSEFLYFRF